MTTTSSDLVGFLRNLPCTTNAFSSADKDVGIIKTKAVRDVDVKINSTEKVIKNDKNLSLLSALEKNWRTSEKMEMDAMRPGPSNRRHAESMTGTPPIAKHRRAS